MIEPQDISWRAVPGFPNYEVSDGGQVRSLDYGHMKKVALMSQRNRRGYPSVSMGRYVDGVYEQKSYTVHSLFMLAFVGPRPDLHQIDHKNAVKTDNRLENLEYCTASENRKRSFRIGNESMVGENHTGAKLSDEKVKEIRRLIAQGLTNRQICVGYGVHYTAIHEIRIGKNWIHVPLDDGSLVTPHPKARKARLTSEIT